MIMITKAQLIKHFKSYKSYKSQAKLCRLKSKNILILRFKILLYAKEFVFIKL